MRVALPLAISSCLLATALPSVNSFVPPLAGRTSSASPSLTTVHVYGRTPPPIPPPPPESDPSILTNLLQKLQQDPAATGTSSSINLPKIDLPSMPKLDINLPSINLDLPTVGLQEQWLPIQQTLENTVQPYIQDKFPQLLPQYHQFLQTMQQMSDSPYTPVAAIVLSTIVIQSLVDPFAGSIYPGQPYPTQQYDAVTSKAYFDQRPSRVVARGLQVVSQSLGFATAFLSDVLQERRTGKPIPEDLAEQRGRELAALLTRLGPTMIKIGQSLSIRTDILSPPYIRGLVTLQDQVIAFDSDVAFDILEEEWGVPVTSVVSEISPKPVASASLGQVYKAKLKGSGQEVAIKVQRPDIMEQIALDMHLLRDYIAATAKSVGNLNSDTVGTVDAWGTGFVDELDYLQEARNAEFFSNAISQTPLKDVVFCPKVVEEYSTAKVLVSKWIDGERLDRSSKQDVTTLCSICMNTYLTMLLEVGLLHCDPHPGNLLRTPDGRLCILDWGMVTRLDENLQLTLIEHMAHLTSADYEEIPRDLLLLGFIPESKKHLIKDSGVVEVLADIYGKWTSGGGVAAFNVNEVISQMQDLTAKKGNLFQIPPYFAYIAKSFSVLEGIGLSNDPQYSIINECLPYVSQRLLTDTENMGPALSTFIFGPEKNSEMRIVDYDRVEQLVTGFGNYTTSSSGALLGKEDMTRQQMLEESADQILDLVFAEEQTPLQDILLEQMAKITAASSRSAWTQLRERSGTLSSGRTVLGTLVDPLGFWRTSPLVRMNDLDQKTVDTTRKLLALLQNQAQNNAAINPHFDLTSLSREETLEISSMLVRKVWERRRGVVQTSNRFARKLIELVAVKLERGERDTRKLPSGPEKLSSTTAALEEATPRSSSSAKPLGQLAPRVNRAPAPPVAESARLANARQLLTQLEQEDQEEASMI